MCGGTRPCRQTGGFPPKRVAKEMAGSRFGGKSHVISRQKEPPTHTGERRPSVVRRTCVVCGVGACLLCGRRKERRDEDHDVWPPQHHLQQATLDRADQATQLNNNTIKIVNNNNSVDDIQISVELITSTAHFSVISADRFIIFQF